MKNVLSILLIAVFLSAQYARQFAYLQCRLATMGAAGGQDCGCGQVTNIDKLGEDGHPLSKNHTHPTLDEFFAQPLQAAQPVVGLMAISTPTTVYQSAICPGCDMAVDRPPRLA